MPMRNAGELNCASGTGVWVTVAVGVLLAVGLTVRVMVEVAVGVWLGVSVWVGFASEGVGVLEPAWVVRLAG
jgi:uncharacterized protein (DUF983 family)